MPRFFVLLIVLAIPSSSYAWGFEAHKFIADRMIELLPPELKPLFEERRPFIVERSVDPDLWRNVGWEEEPPNHFLDMDHEAFGCRATTPTPSRSSAASSFTRKGCCRGARPNSTDVSSASLNP
jgi:hypothetical protein